MFSKLFSLFLSYNTAPQMTTMLKVWHSSTSKKDIHANNANYSTTYATTTNRWGQTVSRGEEEKLHVGNSTFKIKKIEKFSKCSKCSKLCTILDCNYRKNDFYEFIFLLLSSL